MFGDLLARVAASAVIAGAMLGASANYAFAIDLKQTVPEAVKAATDLGPVDPTKELNLTVHLKLPNRAAFDAAVDELYNPASPKYEKWMTDAELSAYAPTAAQLNTVRQELEKDGLGVVSIDPAGFSIRVHGTVANIQSAFQTEIHQFSMNNRTFRAEIREPHLTGTADSLVASVSGLSGGQVRPMLRRATDPRTGKPVSSSTPLSKVDASGGLGSIITDNCFTSPKAFTFTTPGASLPIGVYFGNDYDDTTKTCSFTPGQLEQHYGLPAAYSKGYDGAGATIVLVEAYGYPTMLQDANAFSKLTGLPALDSSNFEVIYPEGKPINPNAGVLLGWDTEICIDLQWSHSIAPKAKIVVLAAAGQDNEDFQDAINYGVSHHLGYSFSNSWEIDEEQFAGPLEVDSFNTVLEKAAAQGVSVNFSSGDGGDDGFGSPIGSPEVPADSPYATGVGGTSILNTIGGKSIETGWGNNATVVYASGLVVPPAAIGNIGGAGGGESIWFPKPKWQAAIPGTGRGVPDVSALADPYTGVFIVITSDGTQYIEPGWGGTSLACPIFSAFWAIANQAAGHALGQAAPKIAALPGTDVTDILAHSSPTDVTGTIYTSAGATFYSASDLIQPGPNTQFVSAMWPIPADAEDVVLSFGTDTSLVVTSGWDDVTGFGVPNGLPFILGAAGKK